MSTNDSDLIKSLRQSRREYLAKIRHYEKRLARARKAMVSLGVSLQDIDTETNRICRDGMRVSDAVMSDLKMRGSRRNQFSVQSIVDGSSKLSPHKKKSSLTTFSRTKIKEMVESGQLEIVGKISGRFQYAWTQKGLHDYEIN